MGRFRSFLYVCKILFVRHLSVSASFMMCLAVCIFSLCFSYAYSKQSDHEITGLYETQITFSNREGHPLPAIDRAAHHALRETLLHDDMPALYALRYKGNDSTSETLPSSSPHYVQTGFGMSVIGLDSFSAAPAAHGQGTTAAAGLDSHLPSGSLAGHVPADDSGVAFQMYCLVSSAEYVAKAYPTHSISVQSTAPLEAHHLSTLQAFLKTYFPGHLFSITQTEPFAASFFTNPYSFGLVCAILSGVLAAAFAIAFFQSILKTNENAFPLLMQHGFSARSAQRFLYLGALFLINLGFMVGLILFAAYQGFYPMRSLYACTITWHEMLLIVLTVQAFSVLCLFLFRKKVRIARMAYLGM